ncbi:hypothetical protein [Mycobacterium riyadhense]|uniref:hypothetical protein n=1 Tax=Mycobacterium riyadhense TaxID=486698 RepID=UPI00146FBF33|nr:hypothetical protein [Mycobacterium riyadhense]
MPRFLAEVGQDGSLSIRDLGREGLAGPVDDDGRAAQWPELFDDLGDGQLGALLDAV